MYPVAGSDYHRSDYHLIDLSVNNADLSRVKTQHDIEAYIQDQTRLMGKRLAYGGYQEERDFYLQSELFSDDVRTIHLGIDIWLGAGERVYVHSDGVIHSIQNNDAYLDYGYTIITKHGSENSTYYSLYGHLSSAGLSELVVGQVISEGHPLAYVGDINENGGWAPHLHFQIILDMQGHAGDYPGVCSQAEKDDYFSNCPDPIKHILI